MHVLKQKIKSDQKRSNTDRTVTADSAIVMSANKADRLYWAIVAFLFVYFIIFYCAAIWRAQSYAFRTWSIPPSSPHPNTGWKYNNKISNSILASVVFLVRFMTITNVFNCFLVPVLGESCASCYEHEKRATFRWIVKLVLFCFANTALQPQGAPCY